MITMFLDYVFILFFNAWLYFPYCIVYIVSISVLSLYVYTYKDSTCMHVDRAMHLFMFAIMLLHDTTRCDGAE